MAAILRSVNFAQATCGGRSAVRNFSSYRRRSYESKERGIGIVDILIRCAGATLGCYFGYKVSGHWVPELEEKRQRVMREATGHSGEIKDLREKMWSDAKLVKMFSDLEKKMLSELSGVNLESLWSDLREKIGSNRRS